MNNNLSEEKNKEDGLKLILKASDLSKDLNDQTVSITAAILGATITFVDTQLLGEWSKFFLVSSWVFLSLTIIFWLLARKHWIKNLNSNGVAI